MPDTATTSIKRKIFISYRRADNPDFVERTKYKVELARIDRDHIYTGEAVGYTDYPAATI